MYVFADNRGCHCSRCLPRLTSRPPSHDPTRDADRPRRSHDEDSLAARHGASVSRVVPHSCHSPTPSQAVSSGLQRLFDMPDEARLGIREPFAEAANGLTERRRSRTDRAWGCHTARRRSSEGSSWSSRAIESLWWLGRRVIVWFVRRVRVIVTTRVVCWSRCVTARFAMCVAIRIITSAAAGCARSARSPTTVFSETTTVRLTRPLRRAGPKGSGQFEPVSWAEALGEIAARLGGIVSGHGPATILNAHYTGTCALLGTAFPLRFFHRLGATEVDPDTICNKAGYEALSYLYGDSGDGFDPETASRRAASSSGVRTRRLRRRISTSIGWPRRREPWLSSIRSARRQRLQRTCICSRSRARTRRWPSRSPTFCSATVSWIATSSTPTRSASTSSSRCSSRARRDGRSRRRACRQR